MFEARATATFNHPNIVTIYGVGEHRGAPYVALEYLEGDTLKQRMGRRALHVQEVLRVGRAVARALDEAHAHGILHRDLKPANIMLPPDGRTRVVDFGLASRVGPGGEPVSDLGEHGSQSSVGGGTPNYMAPEQWVEEDECTTATDIWSLGVVLFQMLTQRRPFEAEDVHAVGQLVVLGKAPAPRIDEHGDFPPALSDLVAGCLTRDPDQRPRAVHVAEALDQLLHPSRRAATEEEGPFRGLLPFQEDHAALFFGRDEEIGGLRERLRSQPILPIVGPSGAGKSSLVLAGLIPRLREAGQLTLVRLRPGAAPFFNLAQRLLLAGGSSTPRVSLPPGQLPERAARDASELAKQLRAHRGELGVRLQELAESTRSRVVLIVDQLEEVVVMVNDDAERRAFVDALCAAADDAGDPVRVVLTLRHDFLHRVTISARAREVFSHVAVVQRPADEMLLRTLDEPLAAMGYRFDDSELPREMVAAVAGEPACLPLLQFAAKSLWERRDRERKRLTRQSYEAIGGVEGALVSHADGVLEALDDAGLSIARELLIRLVTRERTRRVIRREQALDALGPEAEAVLTRLVDARLIHAIKARTADGVTERQIELTHESLVTAWSTLARWLDESREELGFVRETTQAAELWEQRGHRPDELWEGDALDDALRRLGRATTALPRPAVRFLQAGQRRREKRKRRLRVGVGATLGILTVIAAVLLLQKREADRLRERALQARDHAEESRAVALQEGARAAYARHLMLESRAQLRLALEAADSHLARGLWWQLQREQLHWRRHFGGAIYRLSFSPDGRELAIGSQGRVAYVLDVETGSARELHGHTDQVLDVAFSPDGQWLATIGYDGQAMAWKRGERRPTHSWAATEGTGTRTLVWVSDAELVTTSGGGLLHHWRLGNEPTLVGRTDVGTGVHAMAYHDQHGLAVAQDQQVLVFSWPDRRPAKTLNVGAVTGGIAWLPDGRLAVGTESGAFVLDGDERRALAGLEGRARDIGVDPKGTRIAAGDRAGRLWLWDANTLTIEQVIEGGHASRVFGVSFSADGSLVASGGSESTVNLWRTDRPPHAQEGHAGMISSVVLSPDGKTALSGGIDETLRVWDVETGEQTAVIRDGADAVRTLVIKGDAQGRAQLLSAHHAGMLKVRDLATMRTSNVLSGPHLEAMYGVDFDPLRRRVAVASEQQGVQLFDYDGVQLPLENASEPGSRAVTFSHDGTKLAAGGRGVTVFDTEDGHVLNTMSLEGTALVSLCFETDDEAIVAVDNRGRLSRFQTATLAQEIPYRRKGRLLDVILSGDGSMIVTGATGDITRLAPDGRALATVRGHASEVNTVAIDGDGHQAATGADDGTVRLWAVDSLAPIWRAPALLGTDRVHTHRGWISPATGTAVEPPTANWAKAIERSHLARARDDLLCVAGTDGTVALWSQAEDRELARHAELEVQRLEALSGGCAALHDDEVHLLAPGAPARLLADDTMAIGTTADGHLWVARSTDITRYDASGQAVGTLGGDRGVSALAAVPGGIALGYRNGSVVVRAGENEVSLTDTASTPVRRIMAGPPGTVVVGFDDGTVGLWDLTQGQRMGGAKLHGPVAHLLRDGDRVAVATALGQHLVWDLSVFTADYCELLRQVWETVPVTWRGGHVERMDPPIDHRCR